MVKEKLKNIPNTLTASKVVGSAHEERRPSGARKGFKMSAKGISIGLTKTSPRQGPSSTKEAVGSLAPSNSKVTWTHQKLPLGRPLKVGYAATP